MEANEKLEVICDTIEQHPYCNHGPTLLFRTRNTLTNEIIDEYYACSAYRSLNDCKFHMKKSNFDKDIIKNKFHKQLPYNLDLKNINKIRKEIFKASTKDRCYCHTCGVLFEKINSDDHLNHDLQMNISDYLLKRPTQFLRSLSNDKGEAQYFFTEDTLNFLVNIFKNLKISKICCIGAPRLYEHLKFLYRYNGIKSFLLDLDNRFFYFYDHNEFGWFNMFNFHFFEGNIKRDIFEHFLKMENDEKCLLFVDPPFGCRTEPLVQTIRKISSIYKEMNSSLNPIILPVMWIFPYFMEIYIKKFMPEMEMIDYKINYDNHDKFNSNIINNVNGNTINSKTRKYGSPIRLFTNISLDFIKFTINEQNNYKYCEKCNKWTFIENDHCDKCDRCPSKNGEKYKHCLLCAECVKPSYQHCFNCGHCTQKFQHICSVYQKNFPCWICRKIGHVEVQCEKWFRYCCKRYRIHKNILKRFQLTAKNNGYRLCLICTKVNDHNERNCPKRKYFLKEKCFFSNYVNILNKK